MGVVKSQVNEEQMSLLDRPFTEVEVALFQMDGCKAPQPKGL